MYQLGLSDKEYEEFRKKVKCELVMRDWSLVDLAKKTKYSVQTIRHFMVRTENHSRFVAFAIADVFGWEISK